MGIVVGLMAGFGTFSYLAFGDTLQPVVLYNLPDEDAMSVATKMCYFITIMGSYAMLI